VTAITATLTSGTAVQLSNGRHAWEADEPHDLGGHDTGPTPYELLLGALAACTCITISLYAARKGIEVRSVSARFEHDRVHRRDCDDCADDRPAYLDRVRSHIVIDAEADDTQKARLADVARRCPVHRTLEQAVVLDDEVVFSG
jgi:putative redox protein